MHWSEGTGRTQVGGGGTAWMTMDAKYARMGNNGMWSERVLPVGYGRETKGMLGWINAETAMYGPSRLTLMPWRMTGKDVDAVMLSMMWTGVYCCLLRVMMSTRRHVPFGWRIFPGGHINIIINSIINPGDPTSHYHTHI